MTRKITRAVGRIKLGLQDKLFLGNLDARRDWGFAGDYVDAMWRMLQQRMPDDYVVATGETHSVREFVRAGIRPCAGLDWEQYVALRPALQPTDRSRCPARRRLRRRAPSLAGVRPCPSTNW